MPVATAKVLISTMFLLFKNQVNYKQPRLKPAKPVIVWNIMFWLFYIISYSR